MKTNINDKYSGKDKKKEIGYLEESKKQILRKKQHNVSRILDNYYWPRLHNRTWWPNGCFLIKRGYSYSQSGLGYFYEKNNVEQLRDISQKSSLVKKTFIQNYAEYQFMDENKFTVTIEYCANCEEHSMHTRHSPDLYKGFALKLQKCIQLRFPFINVLLKPIDTDILKEDEWKLPIIENNGEKYDRPFIVNDKFKEVRIGAMEIQIGVKYKHASDPIVKLIHSKLKTTSWPKIPQVLDKIVSFLPLFQGEMCVYDKEETEFEEEQKEDNNHELILNSKLKDLQVNLYLLRNSKIEQLSQEAVNDVQNDEDPHKRKEMMLEMRRKEKESMYRTTSPSYRTTSANPRGNSAYSMKSTNGFSNTSKTMTFSDKDQMHQMKGKLLMTKYTNKDGIIEIGPLPYDSYFVEVVESTHFMGLGMPLLFYSINPPNQPINISQSQSHPNQTQPNQRFEYIKKYIGLYKQENAFLSLHVYETKKEDDKKDDQVYLPKCLVTLKTAKEDDYQDFLEEKEAKIQIEEKKEGIFEHMVYPGRYLLEVIKDRYEIVRKYIDLDKGFNSINIEMKIERNCNLIISVINYDNIEEGVSKPIQNAEVAIYKNSNEILCECITDKKGEMNYLVTKNEDFLTIVIKKLGYFPVQRMFLRNKNAVINEEGNYEEHFSFYLVKESYLTKNSCTVIVTYSNLNGPNFKPCFSNSESLSTSLEIKCFDSQTDNGIISCFIKYIEPDLEQEKSHEDNASNNEDEEDYEEIIRLSYEITNETLKIPNYQDKGCIMNGLERYCCQTIVYTANKAFFIAAPKFSRDNYCIWDLGWYDAKNLFFYELSLLSSDNLTRTMHFSYWLDFLQKILNQKIYIKLFESFGFDKGILLNNDRFVFEGAFVSKLIELKFTERNEQNIIEFICELFKNSNQFVSFSLLKKKITSNLKNFREDLGVSRLSNK